MFFTGSPICVGIYTNNFLNFSCSMGQHPPCDAPMESPDSALFEGMGSSVPRLYHRKELTNVHTKWVVVLIFWWFLSSGFYGSYYDPHCKRNPKHNYPFQTKGPGSGLLEKPKARENNDSILKESAKFGRFPPSHISRTIQPISITNRSSCLY